MNLLFIQFSDIHFKTTQNSIIDKQDALFTAIANPCRDVEAVFILVTGDTAFSGNKKEYEIATSFLDTLRSRLVEYSSKLIHIIVLPGNHDCDFSNRNNNAREAIIKTIQNEGEAVIDESVLDVATIVQKAYFDYARIYNNGPNLIYSDRLVGIFRYQFEDKSVLIHCYNTAFISQLHEQSGKMMMPVSLFPVHGFAEKSDLILTCFHHPLHWLNPDNRRVFKNYVEAHSDFYFTGHEHQSTKSLLSDLDQNTVYYVEGDVLQDSDDANNSGFNLVFFDLAGDRFQINNYKWNIDRYVNLSLRDKWFSFERGKLKVVNPYQLKKEQKQELSDVGANFTHPRVSNIKLEDVYVFPSLDLLDFASSKEREISTTYVNSESLLNEMQRTEQFRVILQGADNSGKTAFLRVAYSRLHGVGKVPILIPGYRIKKTGLEDFKNIALEHFLAQYDTDDKEAFLQLDKNKLVLIIDDFNKVNIPVKFKGRLVANLISYYQNIIISGNELMTLEDILLDAEEPEDLYSSFKIYEIKEFGYQLKNKLINKWIVLGAHEMMSDEERFSKLNQAESIVNTITNKNIVPSFPVFLLTILQAIEMGSPTDLAASTFGHYYQFLIQKAFANTLKSQDEITSYHNYLSELAFYLFTNKIRSLDLNEFKKFDAEYRKHFTIPANAEEILHNLVHAHILHAFDDQYEFKYLYIYYFFVSKYLADNIDLPSVQNIIASLCKRVYRAEFANILLFLTHHSRNRVMLEEILENARNIFKEINPCKLDGDIEAINRLGGQLPQMVYEVKSVEENREELNNQKDIKEREILDKYNQELTSIPDLDEDISELDLMAMFNLAYKTIEILGQILKNNYGKISNVVLYQLVEETYLLGLRTLNIVLTAIEQNTDFIINHLVDLIDSKNIKDPEKIKTITRLYLFGICGQLSFNFIKKISDSLGTQNLENTFASVLKEHQYNSAQLIDFSVKIDYFSNCLGMATGS